MAASLSRPDPSSPASVSEAVFSTVRRGYQPDEVRAFLVAVAAEMGRLQERERQLQAELRAALEASQPAELDEELVTRMLGEETLRVLQTARESASEIKVRAEENAARTLREASDEANRLRQETDIDVARRRQDAQSDAEAEVALAKQQGREMVNEARAYRERVLADLERRTNLARHQIEELVHGRDRLLQVFERARLVAVDVTSELKAIEQPDELVNLSPTTGPVPVMVPNQRRPAESPAPAAESDESDDDPEPDPSDAATPADVDPDADGEAPAEHEAEPDPSVADAEDDAEADADTQSEAAGDAPTPDEIDDLAGADDTATDEDEAHEAPPRAAADTNVVSLFRGRPGTPVADETDEQTDDSETNDTETDDVGSADDETGAVVETDGEAGHDVGGIFERLRQDAERQAAEAADETTTGDGETDESDDVEVTTAFTRRDEVVVPLIVSGARRLKRVLADEQNEVLDRLRQGSPVTTIDDLVGGGDAHFTAYVDAVADDLTEAAAGGAAEGGIAGSASERSKLVAAGALDGAHERLATGLVTPLRDRLARAVADGAGDNDDITKRVRAVYREWKTQHIDDQLDDVFRRAFAGGLQASIEPGTPLTWTADPSATACPDCEDNSLAGDVPAGTPFPTGHLAAPGHPGCRCLTLPSN